MSAECRRAAVRSRLSTRRGAQPCLARWAFVRRTAADSADAPLPPAAAFDGGPTAFAFAGCLAERCGAAFGTGVGAGGREGVAEPWGRGGTTASCTGETRGSSGEECEAVT